VSLEAALLKLLEGLAVFTVQPVDDYELLSDAAESAARVLGRKFLDMQGEAEKREAEKALRQV
jgi:hypothetical protein